jgi:hypothetical protein
MFYATVAMCTNSVNDVHVGMLPLLFTILISVFLCRSSKLGVLGSCLKKLRTCSYTVLGYRHWVLLSFNF